MISACWKILHAPMVSDLISKSTFSKILSMSNSLDPDQAQHFAGPDLGQNCLQRLTADNKSSLADED